MSLLCDHSCLECQSYCTTSVIVEQYCIVGNFGQNIWQIDPIIAFSNFTLGNFTDKTVILHFSLVRRLKC